MDFIRKCVTEEKTIKPRSVVCSEHFTADCFRKYNNTKLLKEFSVPSISVSRLKSLWLLQVRQLFLYNYDILIIQFTNNFLGKN